MMESNKFAIAKRFCISLCYLIMKCTCLLFVVAICSRQISAAEEQNSAELNAAHAVQIVSPNDQLFDLELDHLKTVLENDLIKDRNVVVVSIAGAFRQGKSFLLNFFIKYLYAQYKANDITDWIGENEDDNDLEGFKWRGGRKRETTGIWMWSEIFTHDYENGEKVAIILLDTQGIFDDQTSVKACTTIFALSMMLSSVQCYNVMHKIREDDLQHLEMFTEYGRLAMEQTDEKPFQKLLFILRDWPYAFETEYGWHGQKVIDEILAGNEKQTNDMRELRRRIDSSFNDIGAFLMPFPGTTVAQGNNFTGKIQEIVPEFIRHVKELVPGLFAPDKLIIKKVNGANMRVRDLSKYLESYLAIFNGDTLPEPKSVFMATAEVSMQILLADCIHIYADSMRKLLNEPKSYFSYGELVQLHQKTKEGVIAQFRAQPKLGGDRLASTFQQKIEAEIEDKFQSFNETNEVKYRSFVDISNLSYEKDIADIIVLCEENVVEEIDNSTGALKQSDLNSLFMDLKQFALQEFESRITDDGEISSFYRAKLMEYLDSLQLRLVKILESYHESLKYYSDVMEQSIDGVASYFPQNDLMKNHQHTKNSAQSQFLDEVKEFDDKLIFAFRRRLEDEMEDNFPQFEDLNLGKRNDFITRANEHNEIICNEIKATFENKILTRMGRNYLSDNTFIDLFLTTKVAALNEFATRRMGDNEITNSIREKLERELDSMQAGMKQINEGNKPEDRPPKDEDARFMAVMELVSQIATAGISAYANNKNTTS